ncbi:hypothetical protein LINPERHAP1_LOCUS26190 [Linum perenne]
MIVGKSNDLTSQTVKSLLGSKSKRKPKREQTEEEKAFKRKAKYFLGAQLVAVLLFLSLLGSSGASDMGIDEDDEDYE